MLDKVAEQKRLIEVEEGERDYSGLRRFVPKRTHSRLSYAKRFEGQVVAVVTKGYIRLSPEAVKALGGEYVACLSDKSLWGLAPASAGESGVYMIEPEKDHKKGSRTADAKGIVRCKPFIDAEKLPNGYYFTGTITHDYILVFSKTPSGKI